MPGAEPAENARVKLRVLSSITPVLLAAVLLASPAHAVGRSASAPPTADQIRAHLSQLLSGSTSKATTAAVNIDGLGAVLRLSPTGTTLPASTEKLFTSLAVLEAVGADTRLHTDVRATQARRGSVLPGDVYLVGGGDPFFSGAQLEALAVSLHDSGIRSISGHLAVDDLRYDAAHTAPGWKPGFVPDESGPLSALAVDRNAWRTDAAFLSDPGTANVQRFQKLLVKHGIAVSSRVFRARTPAGSTVLASWRSAPLGTLVRLTDKSSDNFAAELLLKELGQRVRGAGTSAGGSQAVHQVLEARHVQVGLVYDGSGLSSQDRQSGLGELSLLVAADASRSAPVLRAALPIACQDGTLVKRMCGTVAAGKVVAKTGTLPGTYALTGWTTTADGKTVRFALVLGQTADGAKARSAIDACMVYLSGLRTT